MDSKSTPASAAARCPLQGTETPALQAPLATLDDDDTPIPPMISITPPRELVERIFLLLDTKSMLTCRLVNREFNETIQSSILLQYFLACKAAGVIDNSQSPLSYAERLEALKKREEAWRNLKPVFEMTIDGIHPATPSISRTTEGVFFLSHDNLKDLIFFRSLKTIRNGSGFQVMVLHLTALTSEIRQTCKGTLSTWFFSTGEYHPLARRPRIHVQRSPEVKPRVLARIVGDNLALIVHSRDGSFSDKLFIFDWKTGRKLLQHEVTGNAYSDLDFVSPEIFLIPNRVLSHLEVWNLAPQQLNPKPPIQILSLQIPAVSSEYSLFSFSCCGEPTPFLHSVPYLPPQPFFSSPENSLVVIVLRMRSSSVSSTDSSTSRYTFLQVPWAKWGPPISRWFQINQTQARCIINSNGQRYAFSEPNPLDSRKLMVSVADFNPHNLRNAEMMARLGNGEGEDNGNNGNNEEGKEEEEFELLDHKGVFSEEVYMGLKCVVYRVPDEYDFDAVVMEEQRLLGAKLKRHNSGESIKVLYIG
ncbi:hypothetical protein JOM56_005321 [Amanita muscaria]